MRIFQYWDTGEPPGDVAECIESVRRMNAGFQHQLLDRDLAGWFIGKRVGRRHQEAFEILAIPAMQADYFRLCALWARGGLWIDADERCIKPLKKLLRLAPGGYVSLMFRRMLNGIVYIPKPNNHYIGACLELATRNVEERMEGSVLQITGPGVFDLIWAVVDPAGAHPDVHRSRDPRVEATPSAREAAALFPQAAEAFANIERRHRLFTEQWLMQAGDLAYKRGPVDWRRWSAPFYLAPVATTTDWSCRSG